MDIVELSMHAATFKLVQDAYWRLDTCGKHVGCGLGAVPNEFMQADFN